MSTKTVKKLLERIAKGEAVFDVCNIGKTYRLKKIKSPEIKGASPTRSVLADLVSRSLLDWDDIPVSLKISMDIHTRDNLSLVYEAHVYKYVVDEILTRNYSPNFIPYLAYGSCKLQQVRNMFNEDKDVFAELYEDSYKRQILVNPDTRFNILITEQAGGGKGEIFSLKTFLDKRPAEKDVIAVFFQLIYSLYIMGLFRMVHNDLHIYNVLVVEYPRPLEMLYSVGRKNFLINTRYIPYIFDWDFAYVEQLGDNPKLSDYYCENKIACNRFSSRTDLYTILCTSKEIIDKQKYKTLYKFLTDTYYTKFFYRDKYYDKITVPKDEIKNLRKYKVYADGEIYKMSGLQVKELAPKLWGQLHGNVSSIHFKIINKNKVELYKGHGCRPTSFDSNYPTPKEIMMYQGVWTEKGGLNIFSMFEVDSSKVMVNSDNIFRAPSSSLKGSKIYIDPFRKSTRGQIVGKPQFKRKITSGYVPIAEEKHYSQKPVRKVEDNITYAYNHPLPDEELDLIKLQVGLMLGIRFMLFDWLYDVYKTHIKKSWSVSQYSLFNAMAIIDLLVSKTNINHKDIQGYGIMALSISEEYYNEFNTPIKLDYCNYITNNNYTNNKLLSYKNNIFHVLGQKPLYGTIYSYVKRYYDQQEMLFPDSIFHKLIFSTMTLKAYIGNPKDVAKIFLKQPEEFIKSDDVKLHDKFFDVWYTRAKAK